MIDAVLVDDETAGLEALQLALEKYCPDIAIKGIYDKPEEALAGIRKINPGLVFLDVQMPQLSGFDLLQQLSPIHFEVIFVSAHDQYAIKAIRFSALDYLLKPIDVEDLMHAVNRVKERQNHTSSSFQFQSVLNNIQLKSGRVEKLAVPTLQGIDFFNTQDILYCKAEGSYTQIVLKNNQQALVCKNLKDFESLLAESGFFRVHHSYIINLAHVEKYVKGEGGYVVLTENHHVDVSRRKKEEFLGLLDKP
ncbi:LytR/AlgR family response regulator transcription factor [Chryseolinea soli]|uniref:DNA-binding response regulator n=1 Tax=Chryseolinea soli TaxID=2321403 RepID=A0A385SVC3_9BACT|nr:LytTR family DNA-binding domain-containing protein [Chryseolinea soli]AYB35169.1 DNA-binding response regulator [Chryseolinea soli]